MTSIICAIVKNEQRFIREWVEHNLNIGFNKIYIYEDYGSSSHHNELKDYINEGLVELNQLATSKIIGYNTIGATTQSELYKLFFENHKKENDADWIGFLDVDEFIMFEDGYDLNKLEEEFKDTAGILLSWRMYGANGHIEPPNAKVVDSYTSYMPDDFLLDGHYEWSVKPLVNVKNCKEMDRGIHRCNDDLVFTNHLKFSENTNLVFKKAWINHYFTKSWEDYINRIFLRGNMLNNQRCLDAFFKCSPEFKSKRKEMIEKYRYRHANGTMWISHKEFIISGGNINRLQQLQIKINNSNYERK